MQAKFEPITFFGSDHRLESEIEVVRDEQLHFRAPPQTSKLALYGPYAELPRGNFRFELQFSIIDAVADELSVQICSPNAEDILYERRLFPWEIERQLVRVSYLFDEPAVNVEFRLRVPAECTGSIRQLSIGLRP